MFNMSEQLFLSEGGVDARDLESLALPQDKDKDKDFLGLDDDHHEHHSDEISSLLLLEQPSRLGGALKALRRPALLLLLLLAVGTAAASAAASGAFSPPSLSITGPNSNSALEGASPAVVLQPQNGLEELFALRLGGQRYHLAVAEPPQPGAGPGAGAGAHISRHFNATERRENVAAVAAAGVASAQGVQIRNVGSPAKADCALSANLVFVMLARFGTRVGRAVWNCRPEMLTTYKANTTCAVNLVVTFNTLARAAANLQMSIANCDPTSYQEDAQCGAKIAKTLGDVAVMTAVSANFDMHCKPFPGVPGPEKSEYPDFSKMNQKQLDFYRMNKVDCGLDIWAASMKAGKAVVAGVGFENNCADEGFEGCDWNDTARTCHEKIRNFTLEKEFPCTRDETCDSDDTEWFCRQKINSCHLTQARKPVQCAALATGSLFQSLVSTSLIALASGRCAPQTNHLPQCVFGMIRIPSLLGSFVHSALTMHLQCGKGGKELKYIDYVKTLEYLQEEKEDAELKMEQVKELKEKIESLHLFDHSHSSEVEG